MAEQKILISIQINDREAANTNKALKVTKDNFNKLTDAEKQKIIADKQLALSAKEVDKALTLQAKASINATEATKQAKTQSGLNNAILLESGRLASDASYGFTAMANNLSQLVSLFGSFIKTNDGVVKSFKALGKSLMGTGGVLLLVQLFIAALQSERVKEFVQSLGGLSKAMVLVKDSFDKANDVFGKQLGFLKTMQTLLNDTNVSQKQKSVILARVTKEHKELNPELDEEGRLTSESTREMQIYIKTLEKKAKSQTILNTIQEEYTKLTKLEQSTSNENIGTMDVISSKFNQLFKGQNLLVTSTDLVVKGEENRKKAINETNQNIDKLTEKLKELGVFNTELTDGGSGFERSFRQQLLNLDKLEESFRQKSIDRTLLTEDEKIDQQEKFAKAELKIRLDQFKERQALRLQEFKESDASAAEKTKAEKEYNESIALAQKEHDEVMIQLKESFNTKRKQLDRREAEQAAAETQKARDINREAEQQALEDLRTFDEEANTLYFEANSNFIQRLIERQQGIIDSEHATADQVAAARKEQFELQRQLRENDLNQEIAAIEAKKAVNLEYAGFAGQISGILSNVAGENEALAKAALVVEKGAAIAKVIITAQTSIAAKTAAANSVAAFLPPFGTPNPAYFVAQAEAKKSNVRTKIGAALSIAQILSTMIGKKGGGVKDTGGGSGGGGRTIQAPDFNVVGASQTSQLAEVVSEQQAKPIKAFVVGKDISTQQELDRNITNTASFG